MNRGKINLNICTISSTIGIVHDSSRALRTATHADFGVGHRREKDALTMLYLLVPYLLNRSVST